MKYEFNLWKGISSLQQKHINISTNNVQSRVALKIFEGFQEALFKEFIMGREPVSIVHYTRPGTCINHSLHEAWIQYQAAHPKLISYATPCKLACCLPQK